MNLERKNSIEREFTDQLSRPLVNQLSFTLEPAPPFRLNLTVWALRRHPDTTIDRWNGSFYRRVILVDSQPREIAVTQVGSSEMPILLVTVSGPTYNVDIRPQVTQALDRLLGLKIDLASFYQLAAANPHLNELAKRFRGLKPTRYLSTFEALVNGIACQRVTLTMGIHLLNRLVKTYGRPSQSSGNLANAFPQPEDLAGLRIDDLRAIGYNRIKSRAMIELSSSIAEGSLNLEEIDPLDDETALAFLHNLRGVGRWTAEYTLLRGLGRLNIFPKDEVGSRIHLHHWLSLVGPLDDDHLEQALAQWTPYAGSIYFHLLLQRLDSTGTMKWD